MPVQSPATKPTAPLSRTSAPLKLYPLAYAAALLPLLTIHLCYLLAAGYGHVAWCIPYIDSCSSISATGRQSPEYFVFKGLMIPAAMLLLFYWLGCERWLAELPGRSRRQSVTLVMLALTACLGLVLYTVMLGAIGEWYQLQRRIGITLFFGLAYLAQLLINYRISRCQFTRPASAPALPVIRGLTALSAAILLLGLLAVAMDAYAPRYYQTKINAFEWSVALLLCLHVLMTGRLWHQTDFSAVFNPLPAGDGEIENRSLWWPWR